ncbi:MAG: DUF2863 family protein [Candidatus Accumulibacter sp.]|nr:DUF2863 family protein [Candidatus Accumulibacter propinquus]
MKRNRFSSRKRISADATELSRLAIGLAESGSKLEDLFWQNRLAELVDRLFREGSEDDFTGSLDRLFDAHPMARGDLADIIGSQAESCVMTDRGHALDILLFAAPVLAWSRFSIPTVSIPKSTLQTLKVHLCAHVFAAGTAWRSPTICTPGSTAAQFCRDLAVAATARKSGAGEQRSNH